MKVYLVDAQQFGASDFAVERGIIEAAGHEFIVESCKNEDDIIQKCADADAILDVYTHMGEKSINALDKCQVLVRYGIGYDSFDVKAATAKGIKVCNIPHYCIPEVAIHTASLVLATSRNLLNHTLNMRAGNYNSGIQGFYKMRRPSCQTVGLVGFGNIARTVGGYLKAAGYSLIAYDPFLPDAAFEQAGAKKVELDELFAQADIITVHTPYTDETHHILNKDAFAKMKDGVIIVNTARGPLICEEDIVAALQSGKVGAAGLDVFEQEPFRPADHPFYHMNNVILSPHAAYESAESTVELFKQVATTAVKVLAGEIPPNVVNRKELGI